MKSKILIFTVLFGMGLINQPIQAITNKALVGCSIAGIAGFYLIKTALTIKRMLATPIKPIPGWIKKARKEITAVFEKKTEQGLPDDDAIKQYFIENPKLMFARILFGTRWMTPAEYALKNGRNEIASWIEDMKKAFGNEEMLEANPVII